MGSGTQIMGISNEIALYMHAGSGNHGCEAILRSLLAQIREEGYGRPVAVMTNDEQEDRKYLGDLPCTLIEEKHIDRDLPAHILYYAYRKITGDRESFLRYRFRPLTGSADLKAAVSIGGDNYCYPEMLEDILLANSMLRRQGTRTVLAGCSVEPSLLEENEALRRDMREYDCITARESITYEALLNAGVSPEKLFLLPDPAFSMEKQETQIPFPQDGMTVGVNLSPMISAYAGSKDIAAESYAALIRHILDHTEYRVALIPHVVWERNSDLKALRDLMGRFPGEDRVVFVPDRSAPQLKTCISACRFFIGSRTHATIAAYSSEVPTLVVGYSVKANGIAKDLFGTQEGYVLPVQELGQPEQLISAFEWLVSNEAQIRGQLGRVMPDYIGRARQHGEKILKAAFGRKE